MDLQASNRKEKKELFSAFRQYYNFQIRKQSDCIDAFHVASELFYKNFGFYIYRELDEYLHELFANNIGNTLLDNSQ